MEHTFQEGALDVVVHTHLHIVQHGHIRKQADILESTGNAQLIDLVDRHALDINAVDQNTAPGGLIDAGEQVEDGGLARAVGADEAGNLGWADGDIEVIHGGQSAEVNAQVPDVQHRLLALVLLTDKGNGGHLQNFLGILIHWKLPPFSLSGTGRKPCPLQRTPHP